MVNDTFAPRRGKDKMDENNMWRTLSNRKETGKCSKGKDGVSSWRRLDRESLFHAHCRQIAQTPMEMKHLENEKKKKERNAIQLSMESEKVESEMGRKKKKLTTRAYKSLFNAKSAKMVVSAIEEPNAVDKDKFVAGPPDSIDSENSSSLPRLRDFTIHSQSEPVEECRDSKATETTLFPGSVSDSRHVIRECVHSKRKRISSDSTENDLCSCGGAVNKDLDRLCTCKKRAQYSNESPREPNTDNCDVGNKRRKVVNENVNPESVTDGERFYVRDAKSVSYKLPNLRKEVRVKSHSEEHGGSKQANKISEIEKKCRKREKKLQQKQQVEIQVFHKIWNEKRDQINKNLQLEAAFIRFVFREVSVRTNRLKCLNEDIARTLKNHDLLKDVKLKNLEAEQLVAMNEEKRKRERWLTVAKACNDEPIAVNGQPLVDENAGVSHLAINTNFDAIHVVSESTEHVSDKNASESESSQNFQDQNPNESNSPLSRNLEYQIPSENESTQHIEDQNSSESVGAKTNTNTSISVRVDPVHCDMPTEMKKLVTRDFENAVVLNDIEGSSVGMVEQSNPLKPLCDSGELFCTKFPVFEDQSVNLTTESSVEMPAKAPNENISQDKVHSSFAERTTQIHRADQNQHDPQVGDPELVDIVTAVQSSGKLEEGEIQEVEIEGEIQELEVEESQIQEEGPTIGNQGIVNSETVAIVEPKEEAPIMEEEQRTVNFQTIANVEPVLMTEKPDENVPVLRNQHNLEIQVEMLQPVNDSLTDGQSNVELQDVVTRALEIKSTSKVANLDLVYTMDPAQPIREQPRADSTTIANQNDYVSQARFSSQATDLVKADLNRAGKRAQHSDFNHSPDLSGSRSTDGAHKCVRKGRGFTADYAFVRQYRTPSPEPDRPCFYGGRDIERNNNRYSSYRGRYVHSPQGRCSSPANGDCSEGIHEPTSRIGSLDPITEQPLADAETENQNICLIQAPLSHEPASQLVSQIDTIRPITEQPSADANAVKSQNASHIEDVAGAETLGTEPAQICLPENQNTSLTETPFLSQIADMAETEVHSHETASQIEHIHSIIEHPQVDKETAENQNPSVTKVPLSSQIAGVLEIEELSHETVSQSMENLETRSFSNERIVELTTYSESNEPLCESVIGEAELLIEGVPQNETCASYIYGSGHLLPCLNTHSFDPIESEIEKTIKHTEDLERSHLNMAAQLKSNCEKEIQEMMNQIKQKYGMQLQVAEAEFRQRKSEFEKYRNKLQMNKKLAEAFRKKLTDLWPIGHPVNQQGTSESIYMQQMLHLSVDPSLRVMTNASNFQPSPSHSNIIMPHQSLAQTTRFSQITSHSVTAPNVHSRSQPNASSVRPIVPQHLLARPTMFSTITRHPVTVPHALPLHPVHQAHAFFSAPPRPPPVTRPVMLSNNLHASREIGSVAPHLQSYRPSMGLTTSSSIPYYHSTFQSGPVPQDGLLAPHSSTMNPWSRVWVDSGLGFSEMRQNYSSLGLGVQGGNNVHGNHPSSDVVCLSDDD